MFSILIDWLAKYLVSINKLYSKSLFNIFLTFTILLQSFNFIFFLQCIYYLISLIIGYVKHWLEISTWNSGPSLNTGHQSFIARSIGRDQDRKCDFLFKVVDSTLKIKIMGRCFLFTRRIGSKREKKVAAFHIRLKKPRFL
jgi:hypothetical protein